MNKKKPKIFDLIKKLNSHSDKIKIRARVKYDKDKELIGYTVYLDYYYKKNRQLEYLDKSLHLDGSISSLPSDKEKLRLIEALRNKKQLELIEQKTGFNLKEVQDKDFIDYFSKNCKDSVFKGSLKRFKMFIKRDSIRFDEIDHKLCNNFAEYLKKEIKPNSAVSYFAKLKIVLNKAVKEKLIQENPANNISLKGEQSKREFFSLEEIQILAKTEKTNINSCNGFIFCCFAGLRFSDVKKLKYSDIKEGYIEFKQKKTGQNERMKLSSSALKIIDKQKKTVVSDYVFNFMHYSQVERHLKEWVKRAEINKNITFHSSRHTFATLSLTNDIDIFTVSKLLGHRDLKTTQIYAKLIDKKKDQAIDKLPEIDI
ncbi:MAG: site-specific integrase [Candidatus Delongbacteria bacterium]|nr:site-specific integrase [Candidatus Delongbacteria bacterium]